MSSEQQSTGLSDCCTSGHLHEGTPNGTVGPLPGTTMEAYFTGETSNKARTILFVTDIFGFALNNTRLLADEYAQAGFYVVVPDILEGDPVPDELLKDLAPLDSTPEPGFVGKASSTAKVAFNLPPWVAKHREAVTRPLVEQAAKALKADPEVKKLGAVGFCLGGRYALLLSHKTADPNSPFVDAVVANHPSMLSLPDDITQVTKPLLVNIGEKDSMLDTKARTQIKEAFLKQLSDIPTKWEEYDRAVHGFAVRGDYNIELEKKNKELACKNTVEWFDKYL